MVSVCVIGSSLRILSKLNFLRISRDVKAVICDMEVANVGCERNHKSIDHGGSHDTNRIMNLDRGEFALALRCVLSV